MKKILSGFALKPEKCMLVISGNIILSFGLYNIHSLSDVTEGGVLGLMLFFAHWFGISPAVSGFIMNMACYLFGAKIKGKDFITYSVLSGIVFSVAYFVFEKLGPVYPEISQYPFAAAIAGGIFVGVGAGLCVRAGAATSGDDALVMGISTVTGVDIRWIYLVTDISVLLLSLTYIPLLRITYSLITVVLSGQIIGLIQKAQIGKQN